MLAFEGLGSMINPTEQVRQVKEFSDGTQSQLRHSDGQASVVQLPLPSGLVPWLSTLGFSGAQVIQSPVTSSQVAHNEEQAPHSLSVEPVPPIHSFTPHSGQHPGFESVFALNPVEQVVH